MFVMFVCVYVLPRINGDNFNEWVLPDLWQVQSSASESPAPIFLLTQETNCVA